MPISRIPGVGLETTGTASVNTFLRGDNAWAGTITSGTAVTASGTSIDFTGIPSTAKRITVMFNGIQKSSSANFLVQIGSTTFTTTGYKSVSGFVGSGGSGGVTSTAGFVTSGDAASTVDVYGAFTLLNISGNSWVATYSAANFANNYGVSGGGSVTLSGVLDRVRVTTTSGTDTFTAGTINIMWES